MTNLRHSRGALFETPKEIVQRYKRLSATRWLNIFYFVITVTIASCSPPKQEEQSAAATVQFDTGAIKTSDTAGREVASTNLPATNASVTVKVFSNEGDTKLAGYGYDIYIDGKLYVHQPHIPAVAGSRGFTSEMDAKKTADYVAYKIQHNIMPPSVTVEELDSLDVK